MKPGVRHWARRRAAGLRLLAAGLSLWLALAGPAAAQALSPPQAPALPQAPAPAGDPNAPLGDYTLTLSLPPGDLRDKTLPVITLARRPAQSRAELDARLAADAGRVARVLRAEGYFDGEVTPVVEEGPPRAARFQVRSGARYALGRVEVEGLPPGLAPPPLTHGPASGAAIVAYETAVLDLLRAQGYADAARVSRVAELDRARLAVDVAWVFAPGPRVAIGEVSVSGLREVREEHVRRLAGFTQGEPLTPARLRRAEDALIAADLFSAVRIAPGEGDPRPVAIALEERKHRTFGGGLRWASDEGVGLNAFWRHRNLFGAGEALQADLRLSELLQSLDGLYRESGVGRPGQVLTLTARLASERTDAFDGELASLGAALERPLDDNLIGRLGVLLEASQAREDAGDLSAVLLGVPAALAWDDTEDLLDPREGARAEIRLTPYAGWGDGGALAFATVEALGAAYWPLDEAQETVLALRGRAGATIGPAAASLPPARRFYAGGGGSVRGYGFQRAGPLDATGDPIGGKSVLEASAELRFRVTESFGGAVFADAGAAFAEATPRWSDVVAGVGVGVRYYSPIGPLRLDIAFPLDQRTGDESFQVYVSIGQAF